MGCSSGFDTVNSDPLMIDYLFDQGKITARKFAFSLGKEDETSFMDVGVIRDAAMSDPADLVWLDADPDDYWWTTDVEGFRFTSHD